MKHLLYTSFLMLTLLLSACASNQSDEARDEASDAPYSEGGDAATTDLALEKLESELSDESVAAANGAPIEPPPMDGPNPSDPSLFAPSDVAMNDAAALQPPTEPNSARSATQPVGDGFAQTEAGPTGGTTPPTGTVTGGDTSFVDDEAALAATDPANYGKAAANTEKPAKIKADPPAPKAPAILKAPELRTQPFAKKKANLNRYYFVRAGDNSKTLSKLLYGNTKRSKDLNNWNASFTPGKIIYYESPYQPQDIEMRSFFEERSVSPNAYTFKEGDTLQKIAKAELGDKKSWTEIAVMNKLPDTASVTPNQQLAVYPKKLTEFGFKEPAKDLSIAKAEGPAAAQQAVPEDGKDMTAEAAKPVESSKTAQADAGAAAAAATTVAKNDTLPSPQPPEKPADAAPQEAAAPAAAPAGFDPMKMLEQNMIPVAAVGGVLVLLLLLRLASKKKRKRNEVTTAGSEPTRVRSR